MTDSDMSVMTASERILYEGDDEMEDVELDEKSQKSLGETTSTGGRSRHLSTDFSGSVFLIASNGQMLSLPIPSESPVDPLGWVVKRRIFILFILTLYGIISLCLIQTPGNLQTAFLAEFEVADMKPFTVNILASGPTLAMGISFFLWIPLSVGFGRRLNIIMSAMLLTCATIGAGFAAGFHGLLAALCLIGFATGAVLSTAFLQIIDLSFIHERPLALAAYWSLGTSLCLVPLASIAPSLDHGANWRTIYRASIVPAVILTVLIFLFVPETYFQRPPVAFDGRVLVQSGTEKVKIYDEWHEIPDQSGTKVTMQTIEDSLPPRIESLPIHTWLATPLRLRPPSGSHPRAALATLIQIILCLGNPLVFWVTLLNALNFGGMMSLGTGFSRIMSQPPYSLSPVAIGRVNYAAAFGSLLAGPATYGMLHGAMRALTLRNKGLRHAEFYLPAFALPVASGAASCFLFAVAVGRGWDPRWYGFAYGLNSFAFTSGGIVNTIWVTESLPQWAAPALGVVGGVSYVVSWGVTAVLPMWESWWSVEAVNVAIGMLVLLVGLLAVPIAFWGRSVRQFIHGKWCAFEAGALRPQSRHTE